MATNRWFVLLVGLVVTLATLSFAGPAPTATRTTDTAAAATSADTVTALLDGLQTMGVVTSAQHDALKAKMAAAGTTNAARADALLEGLANMGVVTPEQTATLRHNIEAAPDAQLTNASLTSQEAAAGPAQPLVTFIPGQVGIHAGKYDFTVSGEFNAFYDHDRPDRSGKSSGLLALTSRAGVPSSSIRDGLLPGCLTFNMSTKEAGWDVGVTFGMWPEVQNNSGAGGNSINAFGAGSPQALSVPGIDFRQQFVTIGKAKYGTVKIGRDTGLFGRDAIFNDFTLMGAGTNFGSLLGSANALPGSVTLGRIGVGYVYTDFMPQITYYSPKFHGAQVQFGIFQPYNDVLAGVTSASLGGHGQPAFQGNLNYTTPKIGPAKVYLWTSFLSQSLQNGCVAGANGACTVGAFQPTASAGTAASVGIVGGVPAVIPAVAANAGLGSTLDYSVVNGVIVPKTANAGDSVRATGFDGGVKVDIGHAQFVAYGYKGWGLGTLGVLVEGTDPLGHTRDSSGYYYQATYTFFKKWLIGGSYGVSHLGLTPADKVTNAAVSCPFNNGASLCGLGPSLTADNASYIAQSRYALTPWVNLVAEYTYNRAAGWYSVGNSKKTSSESVALGTIVWF